MKLIKENGCKIYEDNGSILKVGPHEAIRWEAHVLNVLKGIHGVPQVQSVSTTMGEASESCLIMDLMPGQSLLLDSQGSSKAVLASLYSIITSMYMRGVTHRRLTTEHILADDSGAVSVIGFSKAGFLDQYPLHLVNTSPDFIGKDHTFKVTGPQGPLTEGKGCYNHIVSTLSSAGE